MRRHKNGACVLEIRENTKPPTSKGEHIIQELIRPEPLFHHLFGGLRGYLATCHPTGRGCSCLHPEGQNFAHSYSLYPDAVSEAAEDAIRVAQEGVDAYFCVHLLRRGGSRRGDNALGTVHALWADIDEGRYPDEGPQPTAIIHSSARRLHLYWRLTRPVDTDWAVNLNERIGRWSDADNKWGKASVLRPSGTCNYKRDTPDLVTGTLTGVSTWEPEVMDQAIPPMPKTQARSSHFSELYDGPPIRLAEYLLNVEVIRELRDSKGVAFQVLCPWIDQHTTDPRSGTRVGQYEGGGCWFHCDHTHCEGRRWQDFARKVGHTRRVNPNLSGYTGDDLGVTIHYDR